MATETKEMSLKLVMDGFSKKVIYAEAKKDFVDFLRVPIGSIMTLLAENELNKIEVASSLGRVLLSVLQMETSHFQSSQRKDDLVRPNVFSQNSFNPPLLRQEFASWDSNVQTHSPCCSHTCSSRGRREHECSSCGRTCRTADPAPTKVDGYLKAENCPYMVMDDLMVCSMSTTSIFALLKKFEIMNLGMLQEHTVKINLKKGLEILKASMESDTVLTDVFILEVAK